MRAGLWFECPGYQPQHSERQHRAQASAQQREYPQVRAFAQHAGFVSPAKTCNPQARKQGEQAKCRDDEGRPRRAPLVQDSHDDRQRHRSNDRAGQKRAQAELVAAKHSGSKHRILAQGFEILGGMLRTGQIAVGALPCGRYNRAVAGRQWNALWRARFQFRFSRGSLTMRFTKNIGMLLLAIWLILTGLLVLVPAITFQGVETLKAILAIAAGVFILIGK